MSDNISLLRRAKRDIALCHKILDDIEDDVDIDIAGYHLQQGVEKYIKYKIQLKGVIYPKTHDIYKLLDLCDANNIDMPHWIDENADTLNSYLSESRYGSSIVASKRKILKLLPLIKELLKMEDDATIANEPKNPPSSLF